MLLLAAHRSVRREFREFQSFDALNVQHERSAVLASHTRREDESFTFDNLDPQTQPPAQRLRCAGAQTVVETFAEERHRRCNEDLATRPPAPCLRVLRCFRGTRRVSEWAF